MTLPKTEYAPRFLLVGDFISSSLAWEWWQSQLCVVVGSRVWNRLSAQERGNVSLKAKHTASCSPHRPTWGHKKNPPARGEVCVWCVCVCVCVCVCACVCACVRVCVRVCVPRGAVEKGRNASGASHQICQQEIFRQSAPEWHLAAVTSESETPHAAAGGERERESECVSFSVCECAYVCVFVCAPAT